MIQNPSTRDRAAPPTAAVFDPPPLALDATRDLKVRPAGDDRRRGAVADIPTPGETFAGFRLERELGRGAFGSVFLAHQVGLAHRPVALKVAVDLAGEADKLARLQHAHIVPVYSAHRVGPLQAFCMPYLGGTTLADMCAEVERSPSLPDSGAHLVSTLRHRSDLIKAADAPPAEPADGEPQPELSRLKGMSYADAVLWIGAQAGRRAGPRPRARHRPPGHQAEQRALGRRRPAHAPRLQHRRRHGGRRLGRRAGRRHHAVHVAGAARCGLRRRRPRGRPNRRLLPRRRPVSAAVRPAPLRDAGRRDGRRPDPHAGRKAGRAAAVAAV